MTGASAPKVLRYEVHAGRRFYDNLSPFRELVSEETSSGRRLRVEVAGRGLKVEIEGEAWLFVNAGTLARLMGEVKGSVSEHARNLDTHGDGAAEEYVPVVGDRAKIDPGSFSCSGIEPGSWWGTVTSVEAREYDGVLEFVVEMDWHRPGVSAWYAMCELEEIEEVAT